MKKISLFIAPAILFITGVSGQRSSLDLTFTANDSAAYAGLDSIRVMNRSCGGDTILYWPDTVLSLYYVSIPRISGEDDLFRVYQNYPNPVDGPTTISMFIPEKNRVRMMVSDPAGRVILQAEQTLDRGIQSFRFTPGAEELFFFTAQWGEQIRSIKMIRIFSGSTGKASLQYLGGGGRPVPKTADAILQFCFSPGDTLLCIGYSGSLESGLLHAPETSETYTFQFASGIPCPGTPTVTYEGQVYNTIQVFSQCWLKENLNTGTMVSGTQNQTNNAIIEKYCHSNQPDSCTKYGGLYQWDEMMQYVTQQGSQGICPPGWHLPTDDEWKVLEGAVDSQYGIGHSYWDNAGLRGFDAGKNLKTTGGWNNNGNGTDLFGFSALPASYRLTDGTFEVTGIEAVWWTSTPFIPDFAWYRNIHHFSTKTGRFADSWSFKEYGFSVRCTQDFQN
jgi:uncharacterized protein (TIGR02145 family)